MSTEPAAAAPSGRKLGLLGILALVGVAALVTTGIMSRERSDARVRDWTDAQAVPTVAVAAPDTRMLDPTFNLPGRIEAFSRAPILARVSGYVKAWHVDIGAPVKAGQLLAEIEAPDLDQQLLQARADLLNAQANARLADVTLKRRQTLANANVISQQNLDERSADLGSKQAAVKASQANVDRLLALAAYKRITAPFDGVVTARDTDVGALIAAGGGLPMFVISDARKLRVYVNVPQSFVPLIRVGTKARITVPEYPDRTFEAVVAASAQAIDVATGTTRMQLIVENNEGALLPGGYANVRLDLTRDVQPLHVPASALIVGREGLRVAVVDAESRIRFKTITIARDLGREIEIATGLAAGDRVVVTPPDGLSDGDEVRVAGTATAQAAKPAR
ncbi:RND family efflux transporter MFP subunit [Stella humosa]|uniref:RND family efflux transporter MFP subunit n=1 Tax=Stella humosa TaxID=94 RepID=A0A3N1ME87_9PROT|nr:efflux RND transporter periplasmic adaptor subunit [Stella humosa]ROQ01050.1 RND family efflux transporter MFP subunit [Stella humosa]BBK31421.1 RND transporter MFP subunit [Stella humosa]